MTYVDVKRLQSIDPVSFRAQTPYPWVNPAGLLTDAGYDRLRENLPDVSLSLPTSTRLGSTGSRITIVSPFPIGMIYRSPRPGKRWFQNCVAETIKGFCVGSLGFDRLSCPSSGIIRRRNARSHRIATPTVNLVRIFFISTPSKIGIRLQGGETLILDNGGRFNFRSAPRFEEFERIAVAEALGNHSLLFARKGHSWHGVRALTCPKVVCARFSLLLSIGTRRLIASRRFFGEPPRGYE